MKAELVYPAKNKSVPLPNAATPEELLHRTLDSLLMAASGAGLGAIVLLLLTLA